MADFFFKDVLENEKDRAAKLQADTMKTMATPAVPAFKPPAQATPTAAQPAAGASPYQAPKQGNPFEGFRAALADQDPFKAQVQQGISQTLANPYSGFDAGAKLQKENLDRSIEAEREQLRQRGALAFGGAQSGQLDNTLAGFGQEAIMRKAELGAGLAAGRAQAGEAARAGAIAQGTQLLGQDEQAKLAREQMASTEKLGFADLSVREKALAQEASQFATRQEFDKYALERGYTEAEKARAWQATENEKTRTFEAKQAEIERLFRTSERLGTESFQERLQTAEQRWQAEQKGLDRSLEQLLSNDRIKAQFALADLDQKFQERMQASGFVNAKELETMRNELQLTLQERGFTQAQATQIADQKFRSLEAERDRSHEALQADIQRKWTSGERLETQDFQRSIQASEQRHQEILTRLNATLNLDLEQNRQGFQAAMQAAEQAHESALSTQGFTQQQALQASAQVFQAEMQKLGFSQDQALEAMRLSFQANESAKDRASTEVIAMAQLAQQDREFQAELGLDAQRLELSRKELEGNLQLMGLQTDQIKAAMQNDKVKQAFEMAAIGLEIGDGSPGAMEPFVNLLGGVMSEYFGSQGIKLGSGDLATAMMTGSGSTTPGSGAPSAPTVGSVQDANVAFQDYTTKFKAGAKPTEIRTYLEQYTSGKKTPTQAPESWVNRVSNLPGAKSHYTRNTTSGPFTMKTQEGRDYYLFDYLQQQGLSSTDAFNLASQYIGRDRVAKAYKALTGKDMA